MQTHLTLILFTLFLYLFFTGSAAAHDEAQDLVRSSCIHARYPKLCLRTLSNYSGPAKSPLDIAEAALRVSLAHARRASEYLGASKGGARSSSLSKLQRAALSDCEELISDSVDELQRSLEELKHLRQETFRWQMSNALTWVSAALTDGDTCLDGNVGPEVNRRVADVARVTSNALYLINRLGESGKGKPKPKLNAQPRSKK
ncbi:pectinesterase inhibitor 3-like [Cicer arietinum]|uniref:Pectinesterase inhibitor 3-like n=1 Tax=Cicer arietinum TaxID=3827 RepID=A0A1S2XHH2_CICAR|nr:pectinesterase inhibitor 3-like [Cicer arietinum]